MDHPLKHEGERNSVAISLMLNRRLTGLLFFSVLQASAKHDASAERESLATGLGRDSRSALVLSSPPLV